MSRKALSPKAKKQLLVVVTFTGFFLAGIIMFHVTPFEVKRTYGQFTTTDDGVAICYDVFEPVNNLAMNKSAIIMGHGVMVGKEMMRLIALDLAKAGFVVVPFDFRGHGLSGGHLTFSPAAFGEHPSGCEANPLTYDILAIKQYLAARGDINMTNLGYVGYSMGGGAGFSLLSEDDDFNAMVGLAPVPSYGCTNTSNPRNLLVIIGQYDETFDEDLIMKVMENKTGRSRNTIARGVTYGDFNAGTAARLYVDDNTDHFTALYDINFVDEIRNWMLQALQHTSTVPMLNNLAYPVLMVAMGLEIIGGIGFFLTASIPLLGKYACKQEKYPIPTPVLEATSKKAFAPKFLAYLLPLSLPCIIVGLPLALTPIIFSGIFLAFFIGPSIAVLLLLWRMYKKAGVPFGPAYRAAFATTTKRNISIGVGMGLLLYAVLWLSVGSVLPVIPGVTRWGWEPLFLGVQFLSILNLMLFGLPIIYEKLGRDRKMGTLLSILGNFLFITVAFTVPVLIICVLIGNYFFILGFLPAIFLFFVASAVSVIFYSKTNDIIMPTLTNAITIALFLTTLSPFIGSLL